MVPTISDVSTIEEWRLVAEEIVRKNGGINWSATIVDWPGLGYSDRPKLDYKLSTLPQLFYGTTFALVVPLANMLNTLDNDYVVFGGGHAATIAVRAAQKGLVKPEAIAAVAPTWAGPLPIVFGRDSSMESRYGLLRGTLRAPAIGARYVPAAFLTGLLDPVNSREKFVELFAGLEGDIHVFVVSTASAPKRSKAEMESLRGANVVSQFVG
ncbi:Hypothetical predicted protein [Olea europaea subsp. europaea]|uniref:AB hydrolase-1 domain-containing protein n=1 Tax=Olea europaea subsp. europaea TaxID=158383 RepID=A0A8S0QAC2_OLEEU|nr:Hypothetical predicted protein [Olea europaea subsp. europaea]